MSESQDEFDPPFEAIEPAHCRGPVLFNSPHSGRVYPRAFLLDLAARSGDAAPLRGFLRRRPDRRPGGARPSDHAGALPALLCGRQPRALRTRPAHVRRAGCPLSPIPARCGLPAGSARWRAWSATRRKSTTSAFRSPRRCAESTGSISPITAPCGGCSRSCIAILAPPSWSTATPCRRPRAAGTSARAPMW